MSDVTKDLLEALRGCVEHLEYSTQQGRRAFHEARAAIARAEASLATPQPDADGWIPWAGAYCQPRRMPPDTLVSVKLRCGTVITQNCGRLDWAHDGDPSNIVAYRVAKRAGK